MSVPARATVPAPPTPAPVAVTAEKPRSTKGRTTAKKDPTKDPKEPKEPTVPVAKEKKEKKAVEEKKAEEDAEEDGADGEKKSAAKKRKAGGHGGPRDHPSFEEIIRECIRESKEDRREGVSRPTIKSTYFCFSTFPSFRLSPALPPFPAALRWVWGQRGAASVWYERGADAFVNVEFMESRYGLEMTSLTIANINRAILKGQEKGVFELPKGPSGKVKLAKAAEDKEVRSPLTGLLTTTPDSCPGCRGNCSTRLTTSRRMKPLWARLRPASPPCTKHRQRESARLRVQRLVPLPPNLRSPPRRYAHSRPYGSFLALRSHAADVYSCLRYALFPLCLVP